AAGFTGGRAGGFGAGVKKSTTLSLQPAIRSRIVGFGGAAIGGAFAGGAFAGGAFAGGAFAGGAFAGGA
ncbi:MAG: TPM domain-containing protein, partial [Bdellovibrionota bacterium]